MPPITELTIIRSQWGQGALKRQKDGKMCCLGFLSKACGVPENELTNIDSEISYPRYGWINKYGINRWVVSEHLVGVGGPSARAAVQINDSTTLTTSEKEEKLTKLFAEQGIVLTFID